MYEYNFHFVMIEKGKDFIVRNESKNNNLKLLFLDDIYPILILFIQFQQICNQFGGVILKGNEDRFKLFKNIAAMSTNLWSHKFWNAINVMTKNIEIYEVETMKLYQILPFHYFKIHYFQWNQKQSSFIAFNHYNGHYCVFERV